MGPSSGCATRRDRPHAAPHHAPIGSRRPHRNDLEVYFVEISPANLAPYVIGYERSYFEAIRTFALDRIHAPRLLDERNAIPDDFGPRAHLASAWGIVAGPPREVRLRFRHDVAHSVQERRHRNLRIDATTDDGNLLVTVTCGQDKRGLPIDLLPWIYAFAPGVEVLAPERVRQQGRRELRDAAAAAESAGSTTTASRGPRQLEVALILATERVVAAAALSCASVQHGCPELGAFERTEGNGPLRLAGE